jgi:hypothetical protein
MKTTLAIICIALSILIWSCQKEIDWGSGSSGLLMKTVTKSGTDSTVVEYSYDGAKRLVREKMKGVVGGTDVDNDLTIYRTSAGIITKTVQKSALLLLAGLDSIITTYNYNTSTNRYTSAVFSVTLFGTTIRDSAAFTYDAGGRIGSDEHFESLGPLPYIPAFKQVYTYSTNGTNLIRIDQSAYDASIVSYRPFAEQIYTYDDKNNPLRLNTKGEAAILARSLSYSANNARISEFVDVNDATNNTTTISVYTYNVFGKPSTMTSTETMSGTVSNTAYYYQ